jgi:hypothetical protein
MKPIDQLSLAEVELVVSKLHERVQVPQFELRTGQQVYKPGWGADGPNSVCCTAEIRPIKSNSGFMARYMDDAANADTLMVQTARRALLDTLQHFGLPTDEVEVPSPTAFEATARLGTTEPEFKRGACGCGRCRPWHTESPEPLRWGYGSCMIPTAEGTYCPECGSLLGPGGWALLAGRDPKSVKWPEEDAPTAREEDR